MTEGAFELSGPCGRGLCVIFSSGSDWAGNGLRGPPWEHASVSVAGRPKETPTWEEMAFVKDLFWLPTECVVQFHVPEEDHVNYHAGTLHLWRCPGVEFPRPPAACVGPRVKGGAS